MHLCLCPACRRQLNVTGLDPGATVRCVCGELLPVGFPRNVTIRGLVCGHCGAPVGREDERCAHCTAGLSERDRIESLVCPGCMARLPEDSRHCKACGVRVRPQSIRPLRTGAACPGCDGALRLRLLEDGELVECGDCGGLWVPESALLALRHAAQRGAAPPLEEAPLAAATADGGRARTYVSCVECGELMQRRQFRHAGRSSGVVIDLCRDHGVWFDPGELEAALRFVAAVPHDELRAPAPPPAVATSRPLAQWSVPRRRNPLVDSAEVLLDLLSSVASFSLWD